MKTKSHRKEKTLKGVKIINVINFFRTQAIYVDWKLKGMDDDRSRNCRHIIDLCNEFREECYIVQINYYIFKDKYCTMSAHADLPMEWNEELVDLLDFDKDRVRVENKYFKLAFGRRPWHNNHWKIPKN